MERRRTIRKTPATMVVANTTMRETADGWSAEWDAQRQALNTASRKGRVTAAPVKTPAPDAKKIYDMIMMAGTVQLSTLPSLEAIRAAGLEAAVLDLLHQTAANAANPIVFEFDVES